MACPDELTLDLWLADALPAGEAAHVAEHVGTCASCTASTHTLRTLDTQLLGALALAPDEQAFLVEQRLAERWLAQHSTGLAPRESSTGWPWLVLASIVAGAVALAAWLVAAPVLSNLLTGALRVGVDGVILSAAFGVAFSAGRALFELVTNPLLRWSQPLLVLLALAVLAWPRKWHFNRRLS